MKPETDFVCQDARVFSAAGMCPANLNLEIFLSMQSWLFDLGTLCALIGPEGESVYVKTLRVWFLNRFLIIEVISYTKLSCAAYWELVPGI